MPSPKPSWLDARDETIRELVRELPPREFYGFEEQLLDACAAIVARANGREIVFVGRSPELLRELLRALFDEVRGAPEFLLLPFSMRESRSVPPERLDQLEAHLREHGAHPEQLLAHPRGFVFVDCVYRGGTFGALNALLEAVANRHGLDWQAVKDKTHFLGLGRESVGWKYWRDDTATAGPQLFAEGRADVVSISIDLWERLAEWAWQTVESHDASRWGQPPELRPRDRRSERDVQAKVHVFALGIRRKVRRQFAARLSREQPKKGSPLASLIVQLLKRSFWRRR